MWILYAFLSAVTVALVAIFAKMGLKDIDSILATTIRAIIMAVFLVVVSFFSKKFKDFSFVDFGARGWFLIILAGVAGVFSWLFYFLALKKGLASHVVAIDRFSIVFVILLASLFLGEALGWKAVWGVLLMITGATLITLA